MRFKNWLREIFFWVAEARLAFLCCLVLLTAFFFSLYMWPSEQSIRTSGYVLQILGISFAIYGLLNIRAYFGQPTLRRLSIAWLYRFPKWKKDTVIGAMTAALTMPAFKARGTLWTNDNPEDPLEKRFDGMIINMERIREVQRRNSEQIDTLQKNHEKHQEEQEQARVDMENQIRSDLESLHTDDIVVMLIGLVWLIFGVSMSTMSQELSKIVQ